MPPSRSCRHPLLLLALVVQACSGLSISGETGLARLEFDGSSSYTLAADKVNNGTLNRPNDLQTDFGLDDPEEVPYLRIEGEVPGGIGFSASAFQVDTSSRGTLGYQFGALSAGQSVATDLDLINIKGLVHLFELSPLPWLSIRPGLGMDFFDILVEAEAVGGAIREEIDAYAPLPLVCLRSRLELGQLELVVEGAFMEIPSSYSEDFQGTLLDLDTLVRYRVLPELTLFAGYRFITFDGDGDDGNDEYEMDMDIKGWMVGVGLRF